MTRCCFLEFNTSKSLSIISKLKNLHTLKFIAYIYLKQLIRKEIVIAIILKIIANISSNSQARQSSSVKFIATTEGPNSTVILKINRPNSSISSAASHYAWSWRLSTKRHSRLQAPESASHQHQLISEHNRVFIVLSRVRTHTLLAARHQSPPTLIGQRCASQRQQPAGLRQ